MVREFMLEKEKPCCLTSPRSGNCGGDFTVQRLGGFLVT
jgi:hypothetical protein